MENKSDDSILLILLIRIMDALGNYGMLLLDIKYSLRMLPCLVLRLLTQVCLVLMQEVWNIVNGLITGRPGRWNQLL